MKIKILIVPVLLVLIIVAAIWYVMPAWQTLGVEKGQLDSANAQLANMQARNAKAGLLVETLNNSKEQKNVLFKYLPQQSQEEDLISTLNSLAAGSGLKIGDISIKTESAAPAPVLTPEQQAGTQEITAPAPTAKTFTVDVAIAGDYGKIKDFLAKIVSLERYSSVSGLEISQDQTSGGNLKADMTLAFNYLEKSDATISADNKIFVSGKFDMSVIDMISNKAKTAVNSLTVDASGTDNPFVKK
jgi:Tfp pilus assembly protein PilO